MDRTVALRRNITIYCIFLLVISLFVLNLTHILGLDYVFSILFDANLTFG